MDLDGFLLSTAEHGQRSSPVSLSPSFSSNTALARKNRESPRIRSNRSSERRVSISTISPFKSPSLSSWPQAEVMYSSRSQTLNRSIRSENGNKTEFSSSFERFLRNSSPVSSQNSFNYHMANDSANARRWSRMSDLGYSGFEQDKKGLENFMKLINGTQELSMFRQKHSLLDKGHQVSTNSTLSHFRYLQESYTALSVSISLDHDSNNEPVYLTNKLSKGSLSNQTYSTESSSPLKATINFNSPANQYRPSSETHKDKPQLYAASERNRNGMANHVSINRLTTEQVYVVANSPLKNRKAPPVSPPKIPHHESNHADDDNDDSLVFEMSEICDEENHF
ncbi:hypothetical protein EDC96DRAFT_500118 [Choanephora cucurbitarum]|nr:hypothetical protein EDC96DRAFT_500118 [Choanephora cucurbitarum]